MKTRSLPRSSGAFARRQRGVILIIALIVLVAMTLAAIGMTRSIDTVNLVAGNLGFKQSSLNAADKGIEAGFQWLISRAGTPALNDDAPGAGYFSSAADSDWYAASSWNNAAEVDAGATDAAGNRVWYYIHRMCTQPNTAYNGSNQQCALSMPSGAAGTGGSMAVDAIVFEGVPQSYYRITARAVGPKNTVSVVQSMVAISN